MRYLITRPQSHAADFASALIACGHDALIAPLQRVQFRDVALAMEGVEAFAAASAHAVMALARISAIRGLPLFAVGPQTADAARVLGFVDVRSADGDRVALADLIGRDLRAGARLLHVAGSDGADLPLEGVGICRVDLYEMIAETRLPDAAASALRTGNLDGVFLFSPQSAEIFRACVQADRLDGYCGKLNAYCISEAAAFFLAPLRFAQICIANAPNRAAMLAMLPDNTAE